MGYASHMAGLHAAAPSRERRTALAILAVGTAISLASLFGTIWVVRVGVVAAIAMAFLAAAAAWRQLERERSEHLAQIREQVALRVALTEKHHAESLAMIERFGLRAQNLKSLVAGLRRQLAHANAELSAMRGNAVWLRAEIAERQATIDALTARIEELQDRGDVLVTMPRRGVAALTPSALDIWGADEHPTVVDLQKLSADGLPELRLQA